MAKCTAGVYDSPSVAQAASATKPTSSAARSPDRRGILLRSVTHWLQVFAAGPGM